MKKSSKAKTDKSTVRKYRHFDELRDCLASGWSVPAVHEYLIKRYGPDGIPTATAIMRWRDKHLEPAARVIPHQVIQSKLKGVAFRVDVIGHLSRLIALCEDRVARGIAKEDEFMGMPLAVNDGVIQVYLQAIMDYLKVAQDLNLLPSPPPPLFDFRSQTLVVSPETLIRLKETVREIKAMEIAN